MTKYIYKNDFLFYFVSILVTVVSADMDNFFPDIKGNLTKITWAHAVNNQSYLEEVLSKTDIMMIEADVRVGYDNGTSIPIMAHDGNTSDLSLSSFLSQVKDFNNDPKNKMKGIKLDFKQIEAFKLSKNILTPYYNKVSFPIWLNADILNGSDPNTSATPVKATEFLSTAEQIAPNAILSVGWTTTNNSSYPYTVNQTKAMKDELKNYNFTSVTFPVRAILAAKSVDVLSELVSSYKNSTITIWSATEDKDIDIDGLRCLITKVGISKTYIDVPDSLLSQLHLDTINGVPKTMSLSCLTAILIALFSIFLSM